MTFGEYQQQEKQNTAQIVALLLLFLRPYVRVPLTPLDWLRLLDVLFSFVYDARRRSALAARSYYDEQRATRLPEVVDLDEFRSGVVDLRPDLDRHPIFLAEYKREWMYEALEPAREGFSRPDASQADLARVAAIAAKEVQNGGRRTSLRAVQSDRRVLGFARVAGGGESCAFCTMLISRGPVYKDSPENAGLRAASDQDAVDIYREFKRTGDESVITDLMTRWHENCDCLVVPVFDESNWDGREQYLEAERLWKEATAGVTGGDKLLALRRAMGDGYRRGVELPAAA
jgi:hypothetical protein